MSQSLWIASKARSWLVACPIALPSGGALAKSEIYCEISGTSFAWGAQYGGTVIAPDGAVALFEYDFAKSPGAREALFGEDWLAPTRQQLINRFRPGRRIVGTICADRRAWLRDQVAVVRTAAQSKMVDMGSRDGGTAHTHCFVFEPETCRVRMQRIHGTTWHTQFELVTNPTHSTSTKRQHTGK